ncbi:hypothetical protein PENTCL1PPCAC_1669, partial [Pristionchus entomophagus]
RMVVTPELNRRSPLIRLHFTDFDFEPKRGRYSLPLNTTSADLLNTSSSYLETNFLFIRRLGSGHFGDVSAYKNKFTGKEFA